MSVGQNTQAVNFDTQDLVLVLGENIDLGGDDSGSRNGTGKTTVLNALSYVLYGQALSNIRKENLINKTNGKALLVTVDFEVNGKSYRVERGRKPNIMKFFIDGTEQQAQDDSQGDSRETQHAIDQLLGMSHDMFRHVVALNTYTEPFLSLKANDQRTIIEQLLGITLLSEKADRLREQMKATKDLISQEEMRIQSVQNANTRIQEQINNLMRRQRMWLDKHNQETDQLNQAIAKLQSIDIDSEIDNHKLWAQYRNYQQSMQRYQQQVDRENSDLAKQQKLLLRLQSELASLEKNTCYTCGQPVKNLSSQLTTKQQAISDCELDITSSNSNLAAIGSHIQNLVEVAEPPAVWYNEVEDAVAHRSNLENLQTRLSAKLAESDPYAEQIEEMNSQALEEIKYDTINNLKRVQEHEEFLLKLLTNKDSFVRKKIIDQNLAYLNSRLSYYLYKMGLPHSVIFQSDLSVKIEELGRELDVGNLSRGESNRLILCLSWSFRDVWESLYHPINLLFIDEMIDNGMDTAGVENAMAILKHMTRERGRSVFLISHRDELTSRVGKVLRVIKEGGFTQFGEDQA